MKKRYFEDLLTRGRLARYAGRHDEARVHYATVLEAARKAKDWSLEAEALAGLGTSDTFTDPIAARRLLEESTRILEAKGATARAAGTDVHLALACLDCDDPTEARRLLEKALPVLEKKDLQFAMAFAREVLGMVLVTENRNAEALDEFRRAALLRRQPGGEEASPLNWRTRRDAVIASLLQEKRETGAS